jgi:hypothetical protein
VHNGVFDVKFPRDCEFCCGATVFGAVLVRDGGDGGLLAMDAGDAIFGGTFSHSASIIGSVCILCSGFSGGATWFTSPTPGPRAVHSDIYEGRVG